ncbi:MAG TPA: DUF433 domain-containing protein [Pyrinomonadaceae bacterium]|jgi:uncharacterized protein (DUF433 family)
MSTITTTHIEIDKDGVAWIDDTNVKVIEVVIDKIVHGSSPEEMHFQYPHLSLAQIHAALAYYYDHQAALEAEIERRWQESDKLTKQISDSPLRQKLLEFKKARTKVEHPVKAYRKRTKGDTWHWCGNCSFWPTSDYEEKIGSSRPTTGELCNECLAKERAGNCQ